MAYFARRPFCKVCWKFQNGQDLEFGVWGKAAWAAIRATYYVASLIAAAGLAGFTDRALNAFCIL